jgi:hypothetical protein
VVLRGISPAFARLSPCCGQVVHAILTLTPLYKSCRSTTFSCDLHALTTPPTFVLSQDQTLHLKELDLSERVLLERCPGVMFVRQIVRATPAGPAKDQPKRPRDPHMQGFTWPPIHMSKRFMAKRAPRLPLPPPHNRSLGLAARPLPENSAPPFADSAPTTNRPPGSGSPDAPNNLNDGGLRVKRLFAAKTSLPPSRPRCCSCVSCAPKPRSSETDVGPAPAGQRSKPTFRPTLCSRP